MAVKRKYFVSTLWESSFYKFDDFLIVLRKPQFRGDNATLNSNQTELTAKDALSI